jgi:uncharacterized protein YkwD
MMSFMKISPYIMLFAAALFGALASCSSPTPTVSRVQVSSSRGKDAALSDRVFSEVNSYRASGGKGALQRHAGLDRLARQHCDYLVKTRGSYGLYGANVSHIGLDGRALYASKCYKINSLGENVVSSTNHSAKHLVNLWAGSKGHEHNMRSDWSCTGIATATTPDGRVISTQLFGVAPSQSHRGMEDHFSNHW